MNGQDVNSLNASDLNSVDIDALSDEQIQEFLTRAQESGLTLDQLELVAKQRGMSTAQVAKLRARIRQLQSGVSSDDERTIESPSDRLRETYEEPQDEFDFFNVLELEEEDGETSQELKIFGLDIFESSEMTFEPSLNVATPENYVLGPGDEIIIDVYGASETTYQQVISPDGNIIVSGVGPISLAGVTVEEGRKRIFNKLSTIYSGIRGRNPNTYLQVTVGNVRTIKVNVIGNVVQPGTYTLSSFATAFNALYYAGGPTETGSLREIVVSRNGEQVAVLDVYKYLYDGDKDQNPSLQDQDVIVVKPYLERVKFAGNIKQPAVFEMKKNETFQSLLKHSGGFTDVAYRESILVDRVSGSGKSVRTVDAVDFEKFKLQDGDSIYIQQILNQYQNRVSIEGAIKRPGFYELSEGLTLSELIAQSSGLREDAYLKRGNVIRLNKDLTLKNLSFELSEVMSGNQDILLSPNDIVKISSIFDLNEDNTIGLEGAVRQPGTYPYVQNMTIEDLLNISGGLKTNAHAAAVEIARRIDDDSDLTRAAEIFTFPISKDLGISDEASQFLLQPFDLVLVKSTSFNRIQKVVKVEGEVRYPGFYALETVEDKISDIIKRAGGLTQYGYAKGATLIRRTEYFRDEFEKGELEALIEKRRKELEEQYEDENFPPDVSKVEVIEQEMIDYEKELTENIKRVENSDVLESSIFRAQQLRKLQQRDSISGSDELIEQLGIGIELDKILARPGSVSDLILRDGDLISVPRRLQTVKTQGEVLYPNTLSYQAGIGLKQYISLSGGFSDDAKRGKAYIVYANGNAQRTKNFLWFKNYPPVQPGADIIVPQKKPKRKLSITEVVGIASSLATLGLVIDRLTQ